MHLYFYLLVMLQEIREWVPEIRHALLQSPNHLVQFHALALLAQIDSFDSSTFSKISQKIKDSRKKSPIAMCLLIRLAAKLIKQNRGYATFDIFFLAYLLQFLNQFCMDLFIIN